MKRTMLTITVLLTVLTALSVVLLCALNNALTRAIVITFATTLYHFVMRLVVGTLINSIKHNRFDHTRWWFCERKFEYKLYKFLRIKRWKAHIPTFSPETFDLQTHTPQELLGTTCQSELVHETIMALSFLPLLFSRLFDAFWVFLLTSFAAACVDLVFVLLQRYNRPRLRKLLATKQPQR